MPDLQSAPFDLATLKSLYTNGTPLTAVITEVHRRIEKQQENPIWIHVLSDAELQPYLSRLESKDPQKLPLYGVPFAVKDNIDLANIPTTAGCPAFAYTPEKSAHVVQTLIDAGAIPIGKTNLDQFATGLVGTRSPYGPCQNSFVPEYISGGSSSGSAVSVALGQVTFSLGTDTAGSGRVPASLNNIVGVKPTKGLLSTSGVVPACRSLDCVSIFGLCIEDSDTVLKVATQCDEHDPYSRQDQQVPQSGTASFQFGVLTPSSREFFGNEEASKLYDAAITRMKSIGGTAIEVDYEPFRQAALLLYEGPWVAERYAAVGGFIDQYPDEIFPVTRKIISGGSDYKAADAFAAFYKLQAFKQQTDKVWKGISFFLLPTIGTHYTIAELEADPIQLNSNLGHYTNCFNLLDLCGLALPSGFYPNGMPFGVTLMAPAFNDETLLKLAANFQKAAHSTMGATGIPATCHGILDTSVGDQIEIAVCGAHMTGLPLNPQLTELGGTFVRKAETSANYQFIALTHLDPVRPGLIRQTENGTSVEVEIWSLPTEAVGAFFSKIQAPLGLGTLELSDGQTAKGFICESYAATNAEDISNLRSWREYVN